MTTPVPKSRLRDRSTGDLLVMMIAGTVCVIILGVTVSLIASQFFNQKVSSGAASAVGDIVNTMIGLLAGFLAGRSETTLRNEAERKNPPP